MLAPLAVSVHVPVLPDIGMALTGEASGASLTVSVFLWAFAAAMLGVGPASDRLGRRPVLYVALAMYGLGSLVAALSTSLGMLLAARVLQALGAAALVIVPRAMVRDAFAETTTPMSQLATLQSVAPAIAPLLGGFVGGWFGWRATFAVLVLGVAALAWPGRRLPETRPVEVSGGAAPPQVQWGRLILATWIGAGASAVYFALLPAASDVLSVFGSGSQVVGVALLCVAAGFVVGAASAPRLVRRYGSVGALAITSAALLAGVLTAVIHPTAVSVGAGLLLYAVAAGALLPLSVAEGLDAAPARAGWAASMLGAVQLGVGAGASTIVASGVAFDQVAFAVAAVAALCAGVNFAGLAMGRRRRA